MPEQNTELHGGINRGVLILWLEQCPESIKKKCLRQEKLKKKIGFCNELFVIQNKFGFTMEDKKREANLSRFAKRRSNILEKC